MSRPRTHSKIEVQPEGLVVGPGRGRGDGSDVAAQRLGLCQQGSAYSGTDAYRRAPLSFLARIITELEGRRFANASETQIFR